MYSQWALGSREECWVLHVRELKSTLKWPVWSYRARPALGSLRAAPCFHYGLCVWFPYGLYFVLNNILLFNKHKHCETSTAHKPALLCPSSTATSQQNIQGVSDRCPQEQRQEQGWELNLWVGLWGMVLSFRNKKAAKEALKLRHRKRKLK